MVDVIGTFNKITNYLSSVGGKLTTVGETVFKCISDVEWSDLWGDPKHSLEKTFKGLKDEIAKLWQTILDLVLGKKPQEKKKKDENSTSTRRRRHILEEEEQEDN